MIDSTRVIFLSVAAAMFSTAVANGQSVEDFHREVQNEVYRKFKTRRLLTDGPVRATLEVRQVISGKKALLDFNGNLYMWEGSTGNWVDGESYWLDVIVTDRRTTYRTAIGGTKTVKIIREPTPEDWELARKKADTIVIQPRKKGSKTTEAVAMYHSGGYLLIKQDDKTLVAVPTSRLSKPTKTQIKIWMKTKKFSDKEKSEFRAKIRELRSSDQNKQAYKNLLDRLGG